MSKVQDDATLRLEQRVLELCVEKDDLQLRFEELVSSEKASKDDVALLQA